MRTTVGAPIKYRGCVGSHIGYGIVGHPKDHRDRVSRGVPRQEGDVCRQRGSGNCSYAFATVVFHMVHICLCEGFVHCQVGEIIGTVSGDMIQSP